jgi:hypothetical protein
VKGLKEIHIQGIGCRNPIFRLKLQTFGDEMGKGWKLYANLGNKIVL